MFYKPFGNIEDVLKENILVNSYSIFIRENSADSYRFRLVIYKIAGAKTQLSWHPDSVKIFTHDDDRTRLMKE